MRAMLTVLGIEDLPNQQQEPLFAKSVRTLKVGLRYLMACDKPAGIDALFVRELDA